MKLRLAALALLGALTLAGRPAAAFDVANPYATSTDPASIRIDTLWIFGDSYSAVPRKAFPNWAQQLQADGAVATLGDFAKSGATAGNPPGYTNTWATQIKRWRATSPTFGPRDLTVVYLGHNDIDGGTDQTGADLAAAESAYKTDLKAVIAAAGGATEQRAPRAPGHAAQLGPQPVLRAERRLADDEVAHQGVGRFRRPAGQGDARRDRPGHVYGARVRLRPRRRLRFHEHHRRRSRAQRHDRVLRRRLPPRRGTARC
jgi:hypothetical protein